MNHRAVIYRQLHGIPQDWGTAVNVQAMVFGNMDETSATGVAFSRNPSTGARELYGEFLVNAQGEDVVAGMRTPQAISEAARRSAKSTAPSLEAAMPEIFQEFKRLRGKARRRIFATCRTWSSPSNAAGCGCCKRAPENAPRERR